jgi:hypothetical protein
VRKGERKGGKPIQIDRRIATLIRQISQRLKTRKIWKSTEAIDKDQFGCGKAKRERDRKTAN